MAGKDMIKVATDKVSQVFNLSQTPDKVKTDYNEWAQNYDEMLKDGYNSPSICVNEACTLVPVEKRDCTRVLDVAAGTGLVGKLLVLKGFKNLDAVEPSEGMLEKLEKTGLYNIKYNEFLGMGQRTVPDDAYDLIVVSGGFGAGHIPVTGVDDLVKVSKSGAKIIIVMREEFLETVEAYKDKLEPYMELLERKGVWKKITRKTVPNYFMDKDGAVFCYQKI